uniref:sensor histidine kinase n=2 Tax=unclassified Streptomyces TaxID=2593676 RepID=UPI00315C83B0
MTAPEEPTAPLAPAPRGLTVQAWFMLALAVLGAMTLVAAGVGAALLSRSTDAGNHLVDHIDPARTEAFQLRTALLDQETGVRGYLLNDDRSLLEPYHRGLAAEKKSTAALDRLMQHVPETLADLRATEQAADDWRAEFATAAVSTGGRTDSEAVERGKRHFDRIRERLDVLQDHLTRQQAEARTAFGQARSERDQVFAAVLIAFLLTGVCLAVLLRVTVVRPLTAVRLASRRVARGEFDHAIPQTGPADLRSLAQAVEAMRRRAVSELAASRHYAAELRRRTQDLDAQAVELRRSNAELEQFAYVASHDLQEPLRKVASFCQLLEKRYGERFDERGTQYIAFAVDGAKRMQVLINDLLTFSRVGRLQDERRTVPLDGVLDRALDNLATAIEAGDAGIDRPERLPEVVGDPTLLAMLWQNLIGNAVKFRHPDRPPRVAITVDRDTSVEPPHWTFTVTDNGIGVPPEFAEKVFVIFQRLHSRDSYDGTGIGLSLCKKIVEHSGGRIWIDTSHTDGTRLAFTLPVRDAGNASTESDPATQATTEGSVP